jgi:hypothetical protein
MLEIQYVSDETGNPTAVIVPIELWREIESEKETANLLRSEEMKRRLLEAKDRQTGIQFDEVPARLGIWISRHLTRSFALLLAPPAARLSPTIPAVS